MRAIAAVGVLLLAACATSDVADPLVYGDEFYCNTEKMTLDIMETGRPATELSASARERLAHRNVDLQGVPLADWRITNDDAERVGIVRKLAEPREQRRYDPLVQRPATFVSAAIFTSDPSNTYVEGCAPLRVLPGRDARDYWVEEAVLDPSARIAPSDRRIPLLLNEDGCANGKPATGRVVVYGLEFTPTRVGVVLGIAPIPGGALCPGNPDTPYVLELPEPLGARPLVDVSHYPDRTIVVAPGGE